MNTVLEVWRFRDGKPGHERQTAGLIAALAARRTVNVIDIPAGSTPRAVWHWLRRSWPRPPGAGAPDFLLGAGRACQWPLLAARRRFGGRAIYCMNPVLPTRWFDLCLIPQHDNVRSSPRVEPTFGVLNDIRPHGGAREGLTFMMIGGPSRHHRWDDAQVLAQVRAILARRAGPVVITDSRRTPASMQALLAAEAGAGVRYQAGDSTPPAWLARILAESTAAWVTADSVSMIFEALTAGVGVGLIDVPRRRRDRITRLTESLVTHGRVTAFPAWQRGEPLVAPHPPLDEAARCADLLLARWPC